MSDAEIERTSPPELANLDVLWGEVASKSPTRIPAKRAISLRLDEDVLAWFKQTSNRYQTTINDVLRAYMEYEVEAAAKTAGAPTRKRPRRHTA
jgi:uncharacterized protein (DUF4415 family)